MFLVNLGSAFLAALKGAQMSSPGALLGAAAMSRTSSWEKPAFLPNQNLCRFSHTSDAKGSVWNTDLTTLSSCPVTELPNGNFRVDCFSWSLHSCMCVYASQLEGQCVLPVEGKSNCFLKARLEISHVVDKRKQISTWKVAKHCYLKGEKAFSYNMPHTSYINILSLDYQYNI